MPVRRFSNVQQAEDAYADLEKENIELRAAAKNSVGGFLSRNEKILISLATAILLALGGGNIITGLLNHQKIDKATVTQQEIKMTTEQVAERTNEVGTGIDDVKRELKKKKSPFGE